MYLLKGHDLAHASAVPLLICECSFEPGLDDIGCQPNAYYSLAKTKDVGVIVLTAHTRAEGVMTETRTDSPDLVGRHDHALSGTAHEYTPVALACSDCPGHLGRIVGVVYSTVFMRPVVMAVVAKFVQELDYLVLQAETAVVRCDSDTHLQPSEALQRLPISRNYRGIVLGGQRWCKERLGEPEPR